MPKRLNLKTLDSAVLQGEDSWVKMLVPTIEQSKRNMEIIAPYQDKLAKLRKEGKTQQDPEYQEVMTALNEAAKPINSQIFKAWNWVDNEGDPLPQPSEDGAFELLTIEEMAWLTAQVQALSPEKKAP